MPALHSLLGNEDQELQTKTLAPWGAGLLSVPQRLPDMSCVPGQPTRLGFIFPFGKLQ